MSTSGPYILPVEIPNKPFAMPASGGFTLISSHTVSTKVQEGEKLAIKGVSAKIGLKLIEETHETGTETNAEEEIYPSEEAAEAARVVGKTTNSESTSPSLTTPWEHRSYAIARTRASNVLTTQFETKTERSIFPCPVTAIVELFSLNGTLASMPIQETLRYTGSYKRGLLDLETFYTGEAPLAGQLDLTNPVVVGAEQLQVRIWLYLALTVATAGDLVGEPPALITLSYDREVN